VISSSALAEADVPIPARSMVKFKAGKEMRAEVLKLPAQS
jgi:nucleoid DNA-binding protein